MPIQPSRLRTIMSTAFGAAIVAAAIPCIMNGVTGEEILDDGVPLASVEDIESTVDSTDETWDELFGQDSKDEQLGPVFNGDYAEYHRVLVESREQAKARAEQEERDRLEKEAADTAATQANAGANNRDEIDQSNVAQTNYSIELPEVNLPPISEVTESSVPPEAVGAAPKQESYVAPGLPSNYRTLQQSDFSGKSLSQKIELMGALARQDMHESGILASVTIAQAILESGWMESGLARYNSLFGIKACKLENNWRDSPWNGAAKNFETGEEYTPGTYTTITAAFRIYPNIWDSIKDHSAYLINSRKGSQPRYPGIVGMRDPRAVIQLIKDGGYATSSTYVESLMQIVNMYDLTRYDN